MRRRERDYGVLIKKANVSNYRRALAHLCGNGLRRDRLNGVVLDKFGSCFILCCLAHRMSIQRTIQSPETLKTKRGFTLMRYKTRTSCGAVAREAATSVLCQPSIAGDDNPTGRGKP
jgi:hypothetical protein